MEPCGEQGGVALESVEVEASLLLVRDLEQQPARVIMHKTGPRTRTTVAGARVV